MVKKKNCLTKCYEGLRVWADSLEPPKPRKMAMKVLEKKEGVVWTGFIWLTTGASGGLW
jgi:hypothetical protein